MSYGVYPGCGFAVKVTPKIIKSFKLDLSEYDGDDIMEKFDNAARDQNEFEFNGKKMSAFYIDGDDYTDAETQQWYLFFDQDDLFVSNDFMKNLSLKAIRPKLIAWAQVD